MPVPFDPDAEQGDEITHPSRERQAFSRADVGESRISPESRPGGAARPPSAVHLGRRRSQHVPAYAALSIRLVELKFA
jgi:hypothetical protein